MLLNHQGGKKSQVYGGMLSWHMFCGQEQVPHRHVVLSECAQWGGVCGHHRNKFAWRQNVFRNTHMHTHTYTYISISVSQINGYNQCMNDKIYANYGFFFSCGKLFRNMDKPTATSFGSTTHSLKGSFHITKIHLSFKLIYKLSIIVMVWLF